MEHTRYGSLIRWLAIILGIDPDWIDKPFENDGWVLEDEDE